MPPAFVQVGNLWLNLDHVTRVELIPDHADPTRIKTARIIFTVGKYQDFTAPADVQCLVSWLSAHKSL